MTLYKREPKDKKKKEEDKKKRREEEEREKREKKKQREERKEERKKWRKQLEDIFDISQEVELMREIKDIRDELNILHTLFAQQALLMGSLLRDDKSQRSHNLMLAVQRLHETVERMERNAERPYRAVSTAGDLSSAMYCSMMTKPRAQLETSC